MRDHRHAERVGEVVQPQLDVEPGKVAHVDPQRVVDDWLGPREPDLHTLRVIPQRILGRGGRAARGEHHKGEEVAGHPGHEKDP